MGDVRKIPITSTTNQMAALRSEIVSIAALWCQTACRGDCISPLRRICRSGCETSRRSSLACFSGELNSHYLDLEECTEVYQTCTFGFGCDDVLNENIDNHGNYWADWW